ncbi:hypothetical protein CEXT_97511 [Caerostris extrusa]|uniref:Uncharacterized protein n=1 Tax=Caerostris extrusa TaxID=172846 RepID=A0AAV4VEY8_CAEEX|nr:hypothetical protein CEXT_97511 [Caerostris extrusa]
MWPIRSFATPVLDAARSETVAQLQGRDCLAQHLFRIQPPLRFRGCPASAPPSSLICRGCPASERTYGRTLKFILLCFVHYALLYFNGICLSLGEKSQQILQKL